MVRKRIAVWTGFALCGVLCFAYILAGGCQSQRLSVHGNSGIMSHETRLKLGAIQAGAATEQDVIRILGEPGSRFWTTHEDPALHYGCVATVWKERYLFSRRAIVTTNLDTNIYSCKVYLDRDGKVQSIDYETGTSSNDMHSTPLPRRQ